MRRVRKSALTLLVLALALDACGGSSGGASGSASGSTTVEYTKVTNDAAGEVAAVTGEISSAASGGQADTAAAWVARADRLDKVAAKLEATKAPTSESQTPLAELTRDVTKLAGDVRAVATAGGARSAGARLLDALSHGGEEVQTDLQKLPLY